MNLVFAEPSFSVEIGPTLAVVIAGLFTSLGSWITAWLAYKKSVTNSVENAKTSSAVDQIHTAVNSTAAALAKKLSETEAALLDVTRRLAVYEAKVEDQTKKATS